MGGPGSGRSARGQRFVRVIEAEPASDRPESVERAPLFAGLDDTERDKLDSILVMRVGPVREGTVGQIEPDQGVEEITKRWGGGKYRCQGRNADGRPIKGAYDTIDVAGEPKFQSRQADLEYRRQLGNLAPVGGVEESKPPASVPTSLDIVSIMARQADEREAQHRRDLDRIREEARIREDERRRDDERREKERRDADERREKERREDEERRRKDEEARERRERAFAEEARRRDQEFYASLSKAKGDGANPVDTLLAGVRLAQELGDGKAEGGGVGEVIGQVVAGLAAVAGKGKGEAPAGAVTGEQAATAALPPAQRGRAKGADDKLEIGGALGRAAVQAIAHCKSIGVDPRHVLAAVFDNMLRMPPPKQAPAEQQRQPAATAPDEGNALPSEGAGPPNVTSAGGSASS